MHQYLKIAAVYILPRVHVFAGSILRSNSILPTAIGPVSLTSSQMYEDGNKKCLRNSLNNPIEGIKKHPISAFICIRDTPIIRHQEKIFSLSQENHSCRWICIRDTANDTVGLNFFYNYIIPIEVANLILDNFIVDRSPYRQADDGRRTTNKDGRHLATDDTHTYALS